MKAIVASGYGPPEKLALVDMARPEPRAGEVLVKVHATTVNDWDWGYVQGRPYVYRLIYGIRKPKVSVLGAEVAGTVEAIGEHVTATAVGDRVYGDVSESGFGGFAEYVCVREESLGPMSANMSFEEAASLPHAGMLALQGLVDIGKIQEGERVLINGAGGGVGTIGLHIARQYHAEVTGVDTAAKLETLRALGYDHVIDCREEDFTRSRDRYDVILDAKTNRSILRYARCLAPGGRYVTVGGSVPRLLQVLSMGGLLSRLTGKHFRLLMLKPNKDLAYLNRLFEEGALKCVLDGGYQLADVPRAIRHLARQRILERSSSQSPHRGRGRPRSG